MKTTITLLLIVLLSACATAPAPKPLAFQAVFTQPTTCGQFAPPLKDIEAYLFYTDANNSVIDPVKKAAFTKVSNAHDKWYENAMHYADQYTATKDVDSAKCAIAHLDAWAYGEAGLGQLKGDVVSPIQPWMIQRTITLQAASIYFKVRDAATPEEDKRIMWWLSQNAKRASSYWSFNPKAAMNNHYPWAGAAVMQVAVMSGDATLRAFARRTFDTMLSEVTSVGALPQELARRSKALHYHHHTVLFMVYMAELSKTIGEDWTKDERYQRLLTFTADATVDKTKIEKINGAAQDTEYALKYDVVWSELLAQDDPRRIELAPFAIKGVMSPQGGGDMELFRLAIAHNK